MEIKVRLTESQAKFVSESVATGQFDNADEVVQAALGLLKEHHDEYQEKLEALRAEIKKGFDAYEAGRYTTLETDADIDAYFEDLNRRGKERLAKEANGSSAAQDG